jgi:hypothetical protein
VTYQGGLAMFLTKMIVDIPMLVGIIAAGFTVGFLLRGAQIKKLRKKVLDLEKEMMSSHAEILELQKEKLQLEEKLKRSSQIPVIPINAKEDKSSATSK